MPRDPFPVVGVDFLPAVAADLTLEQVHIFSRHGERSPVRTRMTSTFPARWDMCHIGRAFSAAVLEADGRPGILNVKRVVDIPRTDPEALRPKLGECLLGELTDIGRKTTLELGQALRSLYIDQLHLVSPTPVAKDLYFRSTNMERTIESLQQVITGLFPVRKDWQPEVRIRNMTEESLLPNTFGCGRLARLDKEFAKAAAKAWNGTLVPLDEKVGPFIGGAKVRVDGSPSTSGIMDTVRAAEGNGLKIPPVFDEPAVRDTMENAICHEWFGGYYVSKEMRTLGMGRLLSDLKNGMELRIKGDEQAKKLLVLSCHDTTLASMLATLDVFEHKWPDFTAHVTAELFSSPIPPAPSFPLSLVRSAPKPSHYVRLRYQNRTLALPACAAPGDHHEGAPELCTFEAFARVVDAYTPLDWDKECERRD